jgi:hypothetical protein
MEYLFSNKYYYMNKQININHILWTCYPTNKKEYININSLENFESFKGTKKIQKKNSKTSQKKDSKISQKKNIKTIQKKDSKMIQKKDSKMIQKKDSKMIQKKDSKMIQKKDGKTIQKKNSKKISNINFRKVTDTDPVAKAKIIVKQSITPFKTGGGIGEKNKNWQYSKPNIKNKLAIPSVAIKKEVTDPIDNPNVKNQKVVPRIIVDEIKVKYDSLDGTPLKSDTIVIGNNVFNVVELGDFDPLAFYNLGAVVTSDGNRYINLINSTGTGSNNPISDTYAWAPFSYA